MGPSPWLGSGCDLLQAQHHEVRAACAPAWLAGGHRGRALTPKPPPTLVPASAGLPTFIVFKDGAPVADSKSEGALTKKALAAYLEKHGVQAPVTAA